MTLAPSSKVRPAIGGLQENLHLKTGFSKQKFWARGTWVGNHLNRLDVKYNKR